MSTDRHSGKRPTPRWTHDPRPGHNPAYPVLRPAPGRPLTVVSLGDYCEGCDLHYVNEKTIPCNAALEECEECMAGIGWRRSFYLAVAYGPTLRPAILAITDGAYRACPALQGPDAGLRGYQIRTWRVGTYRTGPQGIEVQRHTGNKSLPLAFDLRAALMRVWGYNPEPGDRCGTP